MNLENKAVIMYQIRLKQSDILNGSQHIWHYSQFLHSVGILAHYDVVVSIRYLDNMFIVIVTHTQKITKKVDTVDYEHKTYQKARRHLSLLNKFYG